MAEWFSAKIQSFHGKLLVLKHYIQRRIIITWGTLLRQKGSCSFHTFFFANINVISHKQWIELLAKDVVKIFVQSFHSLFSVGFWSFIHTMNAIIALCHFCEFHGPSVLFCTQVILETDFGICLLHSSPHTYKDSKDLFSYACTFFGIV